MSRYRDALLFVTLSTFWGGSFVAIEVGLATYPPLLYAAYRFDLAAVLLVGYVLLTRDDAVPRTPADWLAVGLASTTVVAGNNALLFVGQQYTTSGIAAITYSLVPIMTATMAALLLGDAGLDARGAVGVLLGFVGVGLVARPDPANLTAGVTLGVALIFAGVVAVAFGSVGLRRIESTCSSLTLTAWAMLGGAGLIHLASLARGEAWMPPATAPLPLAALVSLGVFSTAAAYPIYFGLLERVGPFQTNLVSYVVPVLATVAGWALLDEPVTSLTLVGFVTIVAGFLVLKRRAIAAEVPRVRARLESLR